MGFSKACPNIVTCCAEAQKLGATAFTYNANASHTPLDPACRLFGKLEAVDRWDWNCTDCISAASNLTTAAVGASRVKSDDEGGERCAMAVQPGIACAGTGVYNHTKNTKDECCKMCAADNRCVEWTFHGIKLVGKCFLASGTQAPKAKGTQVPNAQRKATSSTGSAVKPRRCQSLPRSFGERYLDFLAFHRFS